MATRRLRAALRVFEDVLPQELQSLREELGWIANLLGTVRDLDVQVGRLQRTAAELSVVDMVVPYGAWLEEHRRRALEALDAAVQAPRFGELLERLRAFDGAASNSNSTSADLALERDAPRRLKRAYRRLRKKADGLDEGAPAAAFHKARIRAKWLRYTTEFLTPVYGKPAERLIDRTVALQDLLGDHQDGIVSTQRIEEAIHTAAAEWPAETSLALGRVVQQELAHGAGPRHDFGTTYVKVAGAWKRLRRAL